MTCSVGRLMRCPEMVYHTSSAFSTRSVVIFPIDADSLHVNQAFHVLNNVSTLKGESIMDDGSEEYTVYSSIYDANNQQVCVKTYENNCLQVFNLKNVDLLDNKLSQFEISHNEETKIIK